MQIEANYTTCTTNTLMIKDFNYQNIYSFVSETLILACTYFEPD